MAVKRRRMRLPNGFGQITKLTNKNLRNPYRAMITVGKSADGKFICRLLKPRAYFKTYSEAYTALLEYHQNSNGFSPSITCAELYERWTDEYFELKSNNTISSTRNAWSYCSSVYDEAVVDIRQHHIKECIKTCDRDSVKKVIKSMWNVMLDYALEYEIVEQNYAKAFTLKNHDKNPKKGHIAFTKDEMKKLWLNKDMDFVDVILVQCYSGWRPTELCNLKASDIDLEKWYFKGGLKTESGKNRVVPIHPAIKDLVYERCKNGGSFTDQKYYTYSQNFKRVVKDLGLNPEHRPHDARKTFVTMAKYYDVDEYAIKYIVGHTITDITENTYTERDTEWLANEISKIKVYE